MISEEEYRRERQFVMAALAAMMIMTVSMWAMIVVAIVGVCG